MKLSLIEEVALYKVEENFSASVLNSTNPIQSYVPKVVTTAIAAILANSNLVGEFDYILPEVSITITRFLEGVVAPTYQGLYLGS